MALTPGGGDHDRNPGHAIRVQAANWSRVKLTTARMAVTVAMMRTRSAHRHRHKHICNDPAPHNGAYQW
eukprot:8554797-Pyramimonas_sp.AAC.1